MWRGAVFAILGIHRHRKGDLVAGAMDVKHSVKLDLAGALRRDFAYDVIRPQDDVGIPAALQNIGVHSLVASFATAVAAGRVHDQLAGCGAAHGVEMDIPTFERKRAVNLVCRTSQRVNSTLVCAGSMTNAPCKAGMESAANATAVVTKNVKRETRGSFFIESASASPGPVHL